MKNGTNTRLGSVEPIGIRRWKNGLLVAIVCFIGWAWPPQKTRAEVAGPVAERWEAAAEAYRTKDFERARQIYEGLLNEVWERGRPHPELCYNLGNVYYQLGARGRAIWMYEKTLAVAPRHTDARRNLTLARGVETQGTTEPFLLFKPFSWLARRYTAGEWSVPFLFFYGWAMVAGIGWILGRRRTRLWRLCRWTCVTSAGLTLLFALFFLPRYFQSEFHTEAVVLENSVPVRVAPGDDQDVYFELQAGERLEVTAEADLRGWLRIKRPTDGRVGFLPENTVGSI